MSTWEDRGDVQTSIWDDDVQEQYEDDELDKQRREEEARDSWGNAAQDRWGDQDDDEPQPAKRPRGPGSRGGTPAAFKHGQQSKTYPGGIDHRRAKKKINEVRHPVHTTKKKIKKKAKGSWWWPGSQSHTFHNPNGQR